MTYTVPDVHAHDRPIPPGKVLLAECGQIGAERRSRVEILRTRRGARGQPVHLVARHAGWSVAGSMMRWDNGAFGVVQEFRGQTFQSWFASHGDAVIRFQNPTT